MTTQTLFGLGSTKIEHDDRTTCRGCRATIFWARINGKPHPFNARKATVYSVDRTPTGDLDATHAKGDVYQSHYATCPNAAQYRRTSR